MEGGNEGKEELQVREKGKNGEDEGGTEGREELEVMGGRETRRERRWREDDKGREGEE